MSGERIQAVDDDAALVRLCTKGDQDSFEALVRKYQRRMFNIAFRMTGIAEDAAEIVQDAFLAAWRNINGFKGEAKFTTWLTAITVNHARNRLKSMKARRSHEPVSLDDPVRTDDGERAHDPPSPGPTVLDRMETRTVQKGVQDCINGLEAEFREVLVLRDIQGFSYEEIGGMLKIREGTVKSRLFRARESIKDCLKRVMGTL